MSLTQVMHFAAGKVSRRRGLVPGVGYVTCSSNVIADAICSALPAESPLLLHHFNQPDPAPGAPVPPPPAPAVTAPSAAATTLTTVEEGCIIAIRADYGATFKTAQAPRRRDKLEGTIYSDPDYKAFIEVSM